MNAFAISGALIAALSYIPLTYQVWKGLKQNFATFFLWALLDLIAAVSIFMKDGNYLLPGVYVMCCAGVLAGILRTGTFVWGLLEWLTTALVVLCIVVWMLAGDREATIVSSLAVGIAGVPLLKDIWKAPREAPFLVYSGFTIANALSLLAGKNWSVEERFYPTACLILTGLYLLVLARRWLPAHQRPK